jgi:hypothetical protein
MKNTCSKYGLVCLLLAALLFVDSGCLPKPRGEDKGRRSGEAEAVNDGIDYEKDTFLVPERIPEWTETARGGGGSQLDWATIDSLRRLNPEVDSVEILYRVQLFASQYYSVAGYEKEVAEEIFDQPIYLIYEVPYYKLLMGNCTELSAGERLLRRARSLGYENGWLVQSPPDSIYYESFMPPDSLGLVDTTSFLETPDH